MKTTVLVAFSSRHGATEEIARTIASTIAEQGLMVEVRRMKDVDTVFPYGALVIGSAVYMGRWTKEARDFVDVHESGIVCRPTWLFSSGPVGELDAEPFEETELIRRTGAREHHLFGGRLLRRSLGVRERAIAGLLHARDGDDREWAAAVAWATAIGRSVAPERAA